MIKIIALLACSFVAVLALAAGAVFMESDPSMSVIDTDLASVREQIKISEASSAQYEGGLVKTYSDLRTATYQLAESMLSAKRSSLLRRIDLTFVTDGVPLKSASSEELAQIERELSDAREKVRTAELNASRYTGGLVHSMALVQVETARVAEAQLSLVVISRKYGLTFPRAASKAAPTSSRPGQTTVPDREAL